MAEASGTVGNEARAWSSLVLIVQPEATKNDHRDRTDWRSPVGGGSRDPQRCLSPESGGYKVHPARSRAAWVKGCNPTSTPTPVARPLP